jgi:hypothetical protein
MKKKPTAADRKLKEAEKKYLALRERYERLEKIHARLETTLDELILETGNEGLTAEDKIIIDAFKNHDTMWGARKIIDIMPGIQEQAMDMPCKIAEVLYNRSGKNVEPPSRKGRECMVLILQNLLPGSVHETNNLPFHPKYKKNVQRIIKHQDDP